MGARWYNPGAGDFTSADTIPQSVDPDPAAGRPVRLRRRHAAGPGRPDRALHRPVRHRRQRRHHRTGQHDQRHQFQQLRRRRRRRPGVQAAVAKAATAAAKTNAAKAAVEQVTCPAKRRRRESQGTATRASPGEGNGQSGGGRGSALLPGGAPQRVRDLYYSTYLKQPRYDVGTSLGLLNALSGFCDSRVLNAEQPVGQVLATPLFHDYIKVNLPNLVVAGTRSP